MSTESRNVHVTLSREDADALRAGNATAAVRTSVAEAIGKAEELERAIAGARRLDEEGKLTPVDLTELRRDADQYLRVIWRQPNGEELRCSTFIPLPDDISPALLAGLADAYPRFTAYTYNEAERMIRANGERSEPTDD